MIIAACLALFFLAAAGSTGWAEMTGMAWLANQPDVRSALLGGAVVSNVADASATLWNPAGLAGIDGGEGLVTHAASFADIRREFAAIARNYGSVALGAHFEGVWTDDLDGYDGSGTFEGSFGYYGMAAGLAAGMPLGDHFRVGAGVKYLREAIDVYSATGWAVDLGAQWMAGTMPLQLGAAVLNLGSDPTFIDESFPIPTIFQAGGSYTFPLNSLSGGLMVSADVRSAKDRDTSIRYGVEYQHLQMVSLGVGYRTALDSQDLSFGFTFHRDRVELQYAFLPQSDSLLGDSHRFGLGVKLW